MSKLTKRKAQNFAGEKRPDCVRKPRKAEETELKAGLKRNSIGIRLICRDVRRCKIVEMLRKAPWNVAFAEIIFVENVHFNFELEVLL